MKILIATGIFPPEIGGPATYAKHLKEEFEKNGYEVRIATYGWEKRLPSGVRHLVYLLKSLPKVAWSEKILCLDTYSVGIPIAFATLIFERPYAVRIGGDFLWELYVERTHESLPIPHFYALGFYSKLNLKEKTVFVLTKFFLSRASKTLFTTSWLQNIWSPVYGIDSHKTAIVENALEREDHPPAQKKEFLWAGRSIFLKNTEVLREAFRQANQEVSDIELDYLMVPRDKFMRRLGASYAVILPSLSEVSPNFIHDAISLGKPFIVTKYNGLIPEIEALGLVVDPLSVEDLKAKIVMLSDEVVYDKKRDNIRAYARFRPWAQVAQDFIRELENSHV